MAATTHDTGTPRKNTDREEKIVHDVLAEFSQLQLWRNTFAMQWEEVSQLIMPNFRNTFFFGNFNWPGQKKTQRQVDASGMLALGRFGAILDSLLTPRNAYWHQLRPDDLSAFTGNPEYAALIGDSYVMQDRQTQLWFELANKVLFKYRYASNANFASQNQMHYQQLGAFGTSAVFIDEYDGKLDGIRGLRYKTIPLGELFIHENHQGIVDGFIRWFRMTPAQIMQAWPDTFPEVLRGPLELYSQQPYDILHRVCTNSEYEPGRIDHKGKPFSSHYVCLSSRTVLSEGGYRMLPIACSRYTQAPGEVYGRGPAMDVLPALKTLNAQKATFLAVGHRVADPVLLTSDDGLVDFSLRPGALNKGGISPDGKPLVVPLAAGSPPTSLEMMQEEKQLINDSFLVTLFQLLTQTPQMTATEVIERTNEKGILLAPTVGRQQSEYLGPLIERELDILASQRLLPPMPGRLREAKGAYNVEYTSPLARAMKAQEAAGFMRTLQSVQELVQITQDLSLLDPFNFDVAVPRIAEINSVPVSWMETKAGIAAKRKNRAQGEVVKQQIQALPAQAAMVKAKAVAEKAQAQTQQVPVPGAGPQVPPQQLPGAPAPMMPGEMP